MDATSRHALQLNRAELMLKRLLNETEEITDARLRQLTAQWDARTFAKLRLADVLQPDQRKIPSEMFRFALQSHFDFTVTNSELTPIAAVEYDGPSHRSTIQQTRDRKKDWLCREFGLPLLRINARYLQQVSNGMDLLGWCIHVWFSSGIVREAELSGQIKAGDVSPLDLVAIDGCDVPLPLWFSRDVRAKFWELSRDSPEIDPIPTCIVSEGKTGEIRAVAIMRINAKEGILASTGMRSQHFDVPLDELVEDLAVIELWETYQRVKRGELQPEPIVNIRQSAIAFRDRYAVLSFSTCGDTLFPSRR